MMPSLVYAAIQAVQMRKEAVQSKLHSLWGFAVAVDAQRAIKNLAALSPLRGLNAPRIRLRTPPLVYAPRSGGPDGSGLVLV